MDIDEINELVSSGDALIVETQKDAKPLQNISFSSLEVDSDFSSQQISVAFEELKAIDKKDTDNNPTKYFELDIKSDANSSKKITNERPNEEHPQSDLRTYNYVHGNLHDAAKCDHVCAVAKNYHVDLENNTTTPTPSNDDIDTHFNTDKTHCEYNLKPSQIIKCKFVTTNLSKNKCKSFKTNKHLKTKIPVNLINKVNIKKSKKFESSNIKNISTCQNTSADNKNIIVSPEIHKTLSGVDVISNNSNNIEKENSEISVSEFKYSNTNNDNVANIDSKKKTILIKGVTEADNDLFKNPIKLAKIIEDSELKNSNVNIRVSRNSKTIILEVNNKPTLINTLLNLKTLGNWNIKAYIPRKEQFNYGVISPIDTDVNVLELKEQIMATNDISIHHIERLQTKKNNTLSPSPTIKIACDQDLPSVLNIGFSVFKVRPYIFAPIQCYNCQRLGHTANNCKAKKRCLKCGNSHIYKECNAEKPKCANCGKEHMSNSKQCDIIRNAYNIEYFKAKGLSHTEATNKITLTDNNIQQNDNHSINYRNKLLTNLNKKNNNPTTNTTTTTFQVQNKCNIGTQTTFLEAWTQTDNAGNYTNYQKDVATQCGGEETNECISIRPVHDQDANVIEMMQQFMSKTIQSVCEIINLNLHKLSEEKRTSIITSKLSKNINLCTTEKPTENLQSDNSCPEGVISCESGEENKKEVYKRKKRKKR